MALYQVKVLDWDRRRDFFPAQLAALAMNWTRTTAADKAYTPEDFLLARYPKEKTPTQSHDPDRGAMGDWKNLRDGLKQFTETEQERRSKLKPYAPPSQ